MGESRRVAADTRTYTASLPVVIEATKAAGFDALDMGIEDIEPFPGGLKAAASVLGQSGMQAPTFRLLRDFEGSGEARPKRFEEAEALMDAMAGIGAKTLQVCANTDPNSSGDPTEQIKDLRFLAAVAQSRNLCIGFEPLPWSRWINDYDKAWACVEAVNHPCLGLVLDTFHLFSRYTSLEVLDRITMDKLFAVQLSNAVTMPLPTIEIARHHRLFPSEGEWPVAEVVQRIEARGYEGYYSLEVFNDKFKKQDPFELARTAMESFRRLFFVDKADLGPGKVASFQV